jgi:hypothetical protein
MLTAREFLGVRVRLRGIGLGRIDDVLLDPARTRVLGFDVHCGDGASRFLPWSAVTEFGAELALGSPLPLLEDVAFYRRRARSFRALGIVDLVVADDGSVVSTVFVSDLPPAAGSGGSAA